MLQRDLYQELYLGSELFKQVEEKPSILEGINGFIYHETVLRPVEEIKSLLSTLKERGYHLAIATGRPRTETLVPFESLGLKAFQIIHCKVMLWKLKMNILTLYL